MSKEQNSYLLLSTPCFTSLGKRKGRRSSGYEVGALKKKILKSVPRVINLVPNTFPVEKRKSSGDEVVKYPFLDHYYYFRDMFTLASQIHLHDTRNSSAFLYTSLSN